MRLKEEIKGLATIEKYSYVYFFHPDYEENNLEWLVNKLETEGFNVEVYDVWNNIGYKSVFISWR